MKNSLIYKCLFFIGILSISTGILEALHFNGLMGLSECHPDGQPYRLDPDFDSTFSSAWDIYLNTWDTEVLNPYIYDFNSFNQPVNICLGGDSLGFAMPVANLVTSNYGYRGGRVHNGVDMDLETGDTVVSAFDGVVRISKYYFGYGNMVLVRHHNGLETVYGHLSKVLVEPGQVLKAGQSLGLGGNTGHSKGSHLHFEIRFMGQPIDPGKFIAFEKFSLLNNEVLIDSTTFDNGKLIHRQKQNGKTRPAGADKKQVYHVVRSGDNLSALARRYKTTVQNLCKLNRIQAGAILKTGRKLRVR